MAAPEPPKDPGDRFLSGCLEITFNFWVLFIPKKQTDFSFCLRPKCSIVLSTFAPGARGVQGLRERLRLRDTPCKTLTKTATDLYKRVSVGLILAWRGKPVGPKAKPADLGIDLCFRTQQQGLGKFMGPRSTQPHLIPQIRHCLGGSP